MAIPGVVGVGEGELDGSPCIRLMVVELDEEILQKLPSEIEGYPVDVIETGEFKAL